MIHARHQYQNAIAQGVDAQAEWFRMTTAVGERP